MVAVGDETFFFLLKLMRGGNYKSGVAVLKITSRYGCFEILELIE
jgi:hypothetical protein